MKQRHYLIILILFGVLAVALLLALADKQLQTVTRSSPVSATITQSSPSEAALANPASVNCGKQGGTLVIKKNGTGGEYSLCEFEDNMACEEWALMRGDCPVGGRKTTGYDNIEQMYCVWIGGQTLAVENATCTLPSGKTCSVDAVYNGTCQ